MKVYVDELPNNCAECEFCGRLKPPAERPEIECMHCNMAKTLNSISPFCPLQSLADHDKKVRKEVCDEISWKYNRRLNGVLNGNYSDNFINGYSYCCSDIENILEKIVLENSQDTQKSSTGGEE